VRERRLREKQAEFDPEVAAQLEAEKAKARDEFTE
jgi:hypothetical protein